MYRDAAYSCCVVEDTVFAIGFDEVGGVGRQRYRVEARSARDGSSMGRWFDTSVYSFASLMACTVVRGNVVAVGATDKFWSVIVFDKKLNIVTRKDFEKPRFMPFSVDTDGDIIFVAGVETAGEKGYAIRLEALSADDLSTIGFYTSNPMGKNAAAYSVAYNPVTKHIVIGGFDNVDGFRRWRIEILTRDLSISRIARPDVRGSVTGVAIGPQGLVYAVGRGGVAKIDRDGSIASLTRSPGGLQIIASHSAAPPILRNIGVVSDNTFYLLDENLRPLEITRLVMGTETTFLSHGRPAMDSTKIYIAANSIITDVDWGWRIVAVNPAPSSIFRRLFRI